jgi:hypothetical protein
MSHSDSPKQGSFFLWLIVPAAAILTLMFVNINNNAAAPMIELPGAVPTKEVEEVKHEDHKAHADTTAHATEGAKTENTKAEPAPADHAAPGHKAH